MIGAVSRKNRKDNLRTKGTGKSMKMFYYTGLERKEGVAEETVFDLFFNMGDITACLYADGKRS